MLFYFMMLCAGFDLPPSLSVLLLLRARTWWIFSIAEGRGPWDDRSLSLAYRCSVENPSTALQVTEELVASGVVNARNLAQLLWSLAKIGNPETRYGDLWRHTDKALQGKGSSKPGTGRSDKNKVCRFEGVSARGESVWCRLPCSLGGSVLWDATL